MPETYQKLGLAFQYPENWMLDESEAQDELQVGADAARSVSVYSPGGGFWTVASHRAESDPREFVDATLDTMRQEYDNLDAEPIEETVAGHRLVGYNFNFYCLDLTSTALVRAVRVDNATLLIFCQADDLEFDSIEPVFRAMTESLLSET